MNIAQVVPRENQDAISKKPRRNPRQEKTKQMSTTNKLRNFPEYDTFISFAR